MYYRRVQPELTRFSFRFSNRIVVIVELTEDRSPDAKVYLYEEGLRGDYPASVKLPEFRFKLKEDKWYHHITTEELLQIMNAAAQWRLGD